MQIAIIFNSIFGIIEREREKKVLIRKPREQGHKIAASAKQISNQKVNNLPFSSSSLLHTSRK